MILGGVEAGGTKFVCVAGTDDGEVLREERFPTGEPGATLDRAAAFFAGCAADGLWVEAVGVAAFGPLDLAAGRLTSTPKPGWSGVDVLGPLRRLGVPLALDTDVNGAALAEGRWGAGRGLDTFVYVTVGTGIGAGALVGGRPLHGLPHPEAGHVSVTRRDGDAFPGCCPFHGDCLEGMASGTSMAARWGRPAAELDADDLVEAVEIEAHYLASGFRNIVYTLAPRRIIVGGGVAAVPGLVARVGELLHDALAGYPGLPEHAEDGFVRAAELGGMAGPKGALELARLAAATGG